MKNYRESYGMFVVTVFSLITRVNDVEKIFVTRKITLAAARISQGLQDKLYLGNLSAHEIGDMPRYVECMWLILQERSLMTSLLQQEKCILCALFVLQHLKKLV